MADHNEQTGAVPLSGIDVSTLRVFRRVLAWSGRTVWQCSHRLTLGLISTGLVNSAIPVLTTLAVGLLIHDLTERDIGDGDFALWLLVTVVLVFVGTLLDELQHFFRDRLADELTLHVQQHLYRHADTLDLAYFEDSESLDKLFRVRSGSGRGLLGPVQASINVIRGTLQTLSLFAVMLWFAPLPAIALAAGAVPIVAILPIIARKKYQLDLETTRNRRWGNYFSRLMTEPKTIPTIRVFNLGAMLLGKFSAVLEQVNDRRRRLHVRKMALMVGSSSLFFIILIAAMLWLDKQMAAGTLGGGELAAFGLAAFRARASIWTVVKSVSGSMETAFAVKHIVDFLETHSHMETASQIPQRRFNGSIDLEGVSFMYPSAERETLRGISLHIPAGQTVAIVGQNGAGKSTLMKIVCRLYDPVKGRVALDGIDLREIPPTILNEQLALVQQWPVEFEATVRENIAYGDWARFRSDPHALDVILNDIPVKSLLAGFPEGAETLVGKQFGKVTLSGGQWQQLSIARAMARQSSILILDEPMANLDALAERDLFDWICELGREQTIILISHRFSTVRKADRIVVLDDGCIVEDGNHAELLAKNGLYAHMHNTYFGLNTTQVIY